MPFTVEFKRRNSRGTDKSTAITTHHPTLRSSTNRTRTCPPNRSPQVGPHPVARTPPSTTERQHSRQRECRPGSGNATDCAGTTPRSRTSTPSQQTQTSQCERRSTPCPAHAPLASSAMPTPASHTAGCTTPDPTSDTRARHRATGCDSVQSATTLGPVQRTGPGRKGRAHRECDGASTRCQCPSVRTGENPSPYPSCGDSQ